jgi:VanZ family protein
MALPRATVIAFRIGLAITLIVILFLATTSQSIPVAENLNDKANHLLAFGALALLGDFAFPASKFGLKKFLWLLGYGVLIELIQYFLPYREASLLDVMADAAGLAIYWWCNRILRFVPLLGQRWH